MRRGVSITVTEEDKSFTVSREIWNEWPGRPDVPLTDILEDVADMAVRQLTDLELEEGLR